MCPLMGPFNTVPTGKIYVLQSTGVNGDIVMAPFLSASGIVSGSGIAQLTGLWAPSGTLSASGIASASGIPTGLWAPTGTLSASGIVSGTGAAGGDLSGFYPNPIVQGIQNRSVLSTTPLGGQVLGWSIADVAWKPVTPSGISGAFFSVNGASLGLFNNINIMGLQGITGPSPQQMTLSEYSVGTFMYTGFTMTGTTNFYQLGTMIGTCSINLPTGQLAAAGERFTITDTMGTLSTPTNMILISAPSGWRIDGMTGFLLTTPRTTIDILSVATFIWKIV